MKTWIKGGLIGVGLSILLLVILFIFGGNYNHTQDQLFPRWILVITVPLSFVSGILEFININTFLIEDGFLSWIIAIIIYFIIGALIGWLVGKYKKDK